MGCRGVRHHLSPSIFASYTPRIKTLHSVWPGPNAMNANEANNDIRAFVCIGDVVIIILRGSVHALVAKLTYYNCS